MQVSQCRGVWRSKCSLMLKDTSMWGNDNKIYVEAIGVLWVLLNTGFYLKLENAFAISSFLQNLISIYSLDESRYTFSFGSRTSSHNLALNRALQPWFGPQVIPIFLIFLDSVRKQSILATIVLPWHDGEGEQEATRWSKAW